jgi:predicted metalloprotease
MRWEDARQSGNVVDRRGSTVTRGAVGGGAVIMALVAALLGAPAGTVRDILSGGGETTVEDQRPVDPAQDKTVRFVKAVVGFTEDGWTGIFQARGQSYQAPKVNLFRDAVQSACGYNTAAVGPFYCPPDQQVYLDLSFFDELDRRFGAPGDFAQAYVVAHEVGHHVQNLLGVSNAVHRKRSQVSAAEGNRLSVMTELQADCYAGVWGHYVKSRDVLDPGDVEEGLRAAAAIGDDTLQRKARGRVAPESFTHGTSEQRVRWFNVGLASGKIESCNTFESRAL